MDGFTDLRLVNIVNTIKFLKHLINKTIEKHKSFLERCYQFRWWFGDRIMVQQTLKVARAEGRAEGEKIGIEKERARAYKDKIETAKKFLAIGVSIEQVLSQASGLSIEELQKLS